MKKFKKILFKIPCEVFLMKLLMFMVILKKVAQTDLPDQMECFDSCQCSQLELH